jgi:hypothetical protein
LQADYQGCFKGGGRENGCEIGCAGKEVGAAGALLGKNGNAKMAFEALIAGWNFVYSSALRITISSVDSNHLLRIATRNCFKKKF